MKVQFPGLGYIGLPTAAIVVQKGINVHPDVVEIINQGEIPYFLL